MVHKNDVFKRRPSTSPRPHGSLSTALAHARRLLAGDAALAEAQLREILKVVPGQPEAALLLAAALRLQGRERDALEVLQGQPLCAAVEFERGQAFAGLDQRENAIAAFRRTLAREPEHASAWRALGDQYTLAGDAAKADEAYAAHLRASVNDPNLRQAAVALCENQLPAAEQMLRTFLKVHPTDVGAIRMLAEVGARLGRYGDAEKLLARTLELAPGFDAARGNYATILHRQNKSREALDQVEILLKRDPRNPSYRNLLAAIYARLGEAERSIEAYRAVLRDHPGQPKVWMSLGHTLKTAGHQQEAVDAYRKSLSLMPSLGEAWWSLANLKTFRFKSEDVADMEAQLAREDLSLEDRFHLHFALGKALEDAENYAASFAHYEKANAQRRTAIDYDAGEVTALVQRLKALFTADFFRQRAGWGCKAPDPLFIVGLPRAGSTLIEQILASHSAVEGTMELPDIMALVRRIGGDYENYPQALAGLSRQEVEALGEEYLERTRIQRKLGRPFFIDKMPNNFFHAGFIHLILPNAKIIDARRHPLACGFSCFKQHFARGQGFTYSLDDIGRYYADYSELMSHYDELMPITRVFYEEVVEDLERNVRRLLAACCLPFEVACLHFYENDRIVRTASSEQVRMPIFSDAVGHWRHYEQWLEPLRQALGPALEAYAARPVDAPTR